MAQKADLPTGTRIENQAFVEFDFLGDLYDHPAPKGGPWVNTIDAGIPIDASRVEILPAETLGEVVDVSWTGADEAGGSGIATYDIYVSEDGGPFGLWLDDTTETSDTFAGRVNHTYAFYARATDNVSHEEPAPATADTQTTLMPTGPGFGAAGDSLTDEYWLDAASTWVELLAMEKGVNFGSQADWAAPRNNGYEHNWARSGATSTTLIAEGQHTGLAQQLDAGTVSYAVLAIGQNDFAPGTDAYQNIYSGTWGQSQIDVFVDGVYDNIETALATLVATNGDLVMANVIDYGLAPITQLLFPSPISRGRVTTVLEGLNDRLETLASQYSVPLVDTFQLAHDFLGTGSSTAAQQVGGVTVQIASGTDPHNAFVDGIHPHTILQGALGNVFLEAFSLGHGLDADSLQFTEQELLAAAGIGNEYVTDTLTLVYSDYVILPSANTAPTATAGGVYEVDEGGLVTLDGSGSFDPDQSNTTLVYAWDFDGDGQYDDATGIQPEFSAAGLDGPATITVGLQVTDDEGASDTTTCGINISNVAPVAGVMNVVPIIVVDGETLVDVGGVVTVSGSFSDVGTLDTHTVSIDWGDGTTSDATVNQETGVYEATHPFVVDGPFTIEVSVTDDDSGVDHASATVNVIKDLGVVDFRDDLIDQDPSSGTLWFRLKAAHDAFLTVELGGLGAATAAIALFSADGTPVNALANGPSYGTDYLVAADTSFLLRLSGTAADVDVRLTNLVSVNGADVSVMGTDRDDAFEFELADSHFVRINGTQYHFEDIQGVADTVSFQGGLGIDSATFFGTEADESARFYTGTGEFYSGSEFYDETGFFVDAAAEHLIAHSGGGRDFIKMYDSPDDDLFTATPEMATLVGPGYSHTARGFYVGLGYAMNREGEDGAGGYDRAILDGSADYDKFKLDWASPKKFFGKIYGSGYYRRGKNFESIDANGFGGDDFAVAIGSPNDDEFFLKKDVGRVTNDRTEVNFLGFDRVIAHAQEGYDIVRFEDSTGNDELRCRSLKAEMKGSGYNLIARRFEEVFAEAKNGGDNDKAKLHDTVANDILHVEERSGIPWAQLAVNGDVEDPLYEVLAFEFIKAYNTQGDDKIDRTEEFDWLHLDGVWIDE